MTDQNNTLDLIITHGLTVRQIPHEVVNMWGYREGKLIPNGAQLVSVDGRKFIKTVKIPTHAGKWMAKQCHHHDASVQWDLNKDNLSYTLEEAVAKAVSSTINT